MRTASNELTSISWGPPVELSDDPSLNDRLSNVMPLPDLNTLSRSGFKNVINRLLNDCAEISDKTDFIEDPLRKIDMDEEMAHINTTLTYALPQFRPVGDLIDRIQQSHVLLAMADAEIALFNPNRERPSKCTPNCLGIIGATASLIALLAVVLIHKK